MPEPSQNDYYQVLGVPRGASIDDIRQAHRELARRFHPDLNPGNRSAELKFRVVQEAYEFLSDPDQRQMYDRAYETLGNGLALSVPGAEASEPTRAAQPLHQDRVKPLMGAFVCFLLFYLAQFFIDPAIEFFGGRLMGITLGMLIAATAASALAMTIFESRPLTDLGLHWREGTRNNLLIGVGLGAVSALLVVLVPLLLGMANFRTLDHADVSWRGALFMPILLFCGAMAEELAFRGFVLQYLTRGWGPWAAVLTTGALFGIMHDGNPGANWLSDFNTALFGVLFGFALLRSHDLWLPIGMHFGWNVAFPFLGVDLSGLTIRVTGYELVWKSGDLWSGGKYGPEASPITSAMLLILFAAIWKIPLHKGWVWLLDEPEDAPEAVSPSSPAAL